MLTVWIIVGIFYSMIWGIVCHQVASNKGYESETTKWFFIGLLLGIFGFLIVVTKPTIINNSNNTSSTLPTSRSNIPTNRNTLFAECDEINGKGWRCSCGTINSYYQSSCQQCGALLSELRKNPFYKINNGTQQEWRCSCGAMNRPDEAVCHRCGTAKEKPKENTSNQSAEKVGDELKKYKEMLDQGLITQEDFDAKKKQLLGL